MHVLRPARAAHVLPLLLALTGMMASLPAQAQGSSAGTTDASRGAFWMPASGRTAIGLNVGRSTYNAPCDTAFACDDTGRAFSLYARTMGDSWWGTELGYVDMGRMERAGGDTRARGVNLSLVGKAPVTEPFGVFGKVGVTYGHTRTGTAPGHTIAGGSHNGFGLSLGAGVSWDFTPKLAAVLEWDRHDFRFEGGRDAVRTTSVGLQYKY